MITSQNTVHGSAGNGRENAANRHSSKQKAELKLKFLQHDSEKKRTRRVYAEVELLVVIIIIGVLSLFSSLLNQAAKLVQLTKLMLAQWT